MQNRMDLTQRQVPGLVKGEGNHFGKTGWIHWIEELPVSWTLKEDKKGESEH